MTTPAAHVDPAKTALLLMDFQPAILGSIAESEALLARARDALSWARAEKIQVGYVRVAFTDEDFRAVPGHSKAFAGVAQYKFLAAGGPETQVHESLEIRDEDIVVRKIRFGGFSTTTLYSRLQAQGVDTLILGGVSTSGVVLSTVRDAGDKDYRMYVLSDATADPDPEVHRVLIEKVFPAQADVITTDDLKTLSLASASSLSR